MKEERGNDPIHRFLFEGERERVRADRGEVVARLPPPGDQVAPLKVARGDPGFTKIWSWFPNDSYLLDAIAYIQGHRDELSRDL